MVPGREFRPNGQKGNTMSARRYYVPSEELMATVASERIWGWHDDPGFFDLPEGQAREGHVSRYDYAEACTAFSVRAEVLPPLCLVCFQDHDCHIVSCDVVELERIAREFGSEIAAQGLAHVVTS